MLKKGFSIVYTIFCAAVLILVYLLIFPLIFVCIQYKPWHRFGHRLTHLWAQIYFPIVGMPIQIRYDFKPDLNKAYVFVANHFSYLDIAVGMFVVKNYFSYVGKSSVKKVPLLGYMFAKLHIQVDRSDKNSRTKSLIRSVKALESGRSIFIMPEGGILSTTIPKMNQPFKDGAFIMAIENQVPIVPISFLNLYDIMPEVLVNWHLPKVVIHQAIETKGMTKDNIEDLKKQVYDVIQGELDNFNSQK